MEILEKFNLDGRVALVTGASSNGIGNGAAKILAANGAKVFLTARREDKLKEAVAEIEEAGGTADYFVLDVAEEAACQKAVETCVEKFGRLDIMVLAAGTAGKSVRGGFDDVFDTENWRAVNGANLDGIFFMIKYGYKECAKNGVGSIIPIGSLAAYRASGSAAYTATKGAIRALTKYFAKSFGSLGIRVNTVYPGLIDTDMTHRAVQSEEYMKGQLATTPLGRVGHIDDCSYGVLYLASDASSFMTGQSIVVDGGVLTG